jgi:hypothetical protein
MATDLATMYSFILVNILYTANNSPAALQMPSAAVSFMVTAKGLLELELKIWSEHGSKRMYIIYLKKSYL